MILRCLIVDDEELAQNILETYVKRIPDLLLIGRCDNAIETLSFLNREQIDLIFLDINMPELSGLEMLRSMDHAPMVILTTAYSEYAVESYEYNVVDYLLKPISFERFLKAANKAIKLFAGRYKETPTSLSEENKFIFLKVDGIIRKFEYGELLYFESYGNYLKIHTTGKAATVRLTMQELEESISEIKFIRVHKSYLVNISKIDRISGNRIIIGDVEVPVGNTYKQVVLKKIG